MDKNLTYKFTYWGIISVAFGVFISVSVPSLFHILTIIPAILINYRFYKEKKLNLPKSAWALLGVVILGYVSNFVNLETLDNPVRSFGKLKYFIFAILSISLFRHVFENYIDAYKIKKISNVLFFAVIIAAGWGVYKAYPDRAGGFTGIMRYGYGTSLILSLMFGLFFHQKKIEKYINKKMFLTALVFGSLGLFMSKVRGGILGLFVVAPVILGFYKRKLAILSSIIVAVVLIAAAVVLKSGGSKSIRVLERLGGMSNLKRLSQYETSSRTILNNPIFGLGVNNFSSVCPEIKEKLKVDWRQYCAKYPVLDCNWHKIHWTKKYCSHSHNIVLEVAVNMGVLAGALLILWGLLWLVELWKMNTVFSILMIPFVINVFVAGQFENIFDANNSFMIFLLYPLSFVEKVKGESAS